MDRKRDRDKNVRGYYMVNDNPNSTGRGVLIKVKTGHGRSEKWSSVSFVKSIIFYIMKPEIAFWLQYHGSLIISLKDLRIRVLLCSLWPKLYESAAFLKK